MSTLLRVPETTGERPLWLAGHIGFEPGNVGIKIRLVRMGYQRSFRKSAEIRPLPQEVSSHLRMPGHGNRVSTAHQTQPDFRLWTRFKFGLARLATAMHMGWLGRGPLQEKPNARQVEI